MSDLVEFLLARIAEDETDVAAGVYTGDAHRRIKAECEAKRRIVEEHQPVDYSGLGMTSPGACCICGADLGMGDWEWVEGSFPCATLRALALPYADHPDYRQEWRP